MNDVRLSVLINKGVPAEIADRMLNCDMCDFKKLYQITKVALIDTGQFNYSKMYQIPFRAIRSINHSNLSDITTDEILYIIEQHDKHLIKANEFLLGIQKKSNKKYITSRHSHRR